MKRPEVSTCSPSHKIKEGGGIQFKANKRALQNLTHVLNKKIHAI